MIGKAGWTGPPPPPATLTPLTVPRACSGVATEETRRTSPASFGKRRAPATPPWDSVAMCSCLCGAIRFSSCRQACAGLFAFAVALLIISVILTVVTFFKFRELHVRGGAIASCPGWRVAASCFRSFPPPPP